MPETRLEQYGPFMTDVAKCSGGIIRAGFLKPLDVQIKTDLTPFTEVDLSINSYVSQRVSEQFPGYGFLGEEGDTIVARNSRIWVCDPLDGTRAFVNGIPLGVFSLSLIEENEAVCSVIHDPFMDRTVYAAKREGAWLDGKPLSVSDQRSLKGADVHTSWGSIESGYLSRIDKLRRFGAKVIKMDANVYAGMLVALGKLDGDIYTGDQPWDAAAQALAVREAGGKATTLSGSDLNLAGYIDGALISNGYLHDAILELLDSTRKEFIKDENA